MISSKPLSIAQHFLLFGERAEVALAAPVAARAANPLIEDAAASNSTHVLELGDQVGELGIGLFRPELVRDLEGNRHDRRWVVRERRLGHQDLMVAVGQPLHDFGCALLAREIEEELLDVLDFEGPLLEAVLANQIFH